MEEILIHTSPRDIIQVEKPGTVVQSATQADVELLQIAHQGNQGPAGVQGIKGDDGDQGPPGSGGDLTYVHNQVSSASTWDIVHNLNKFPSVHAVDSAGTSVEGEILYVSSNEVTISFTSAFGGKAYIN